MQYFVHLSWLKINEPTFFSQVFYICCTSSPSKRLPGRDTLPKNPSQAAAAQQIPEFPSDLKSKNMSEFEHCYTLRCTLLFQVIFKNNLWMGIKINFRYHNRIAIACLAFIFIIPIHPFALTSCIFQILYIVIIWLQQAEQNPRFACPDLCLSDTIR